MRVIWLMLVVYSIFVTVWTLKAGNFGKFNLRLDKFENCKGPKRKDCAEITVNMLNDTAVLYDLRLKQSVRITKGKIVANANNSDFLRLQVKDPCDHIFLQQFLQATLNMTRNCVVKPHKYKFVVDIAEIAEKYYGGSFLYGTFMFKSFFLAEDCNFSCANVVVTFIPKK